MEYDSYASATYFKEKLVTIYYSFLLPQREDTIHLFMREYEELLCSLHCASVVPKESSGHTSPEYIHVLKMLYKLIAQTRDFSYGKGERILTYMMIYVWWKYYPFMGLALLRSMVGREHVFDDDFLLYIDTSKTYVVHENSYGCFKDIKYFCNYVKKYGAEKYGKDKQNENGQLCDYAITLLNQRIYDDYTEYCKNGTLPSIACKWVPRENSKYGWIFEKMAIQWANATNPLILSSFDLHQYSGMNVSFQHSKAIKKCKMIYRKVISQLSRLLDLPETKQCNREWSNIDVSKITLDAMFRNSNALFNIDNTFDYREHTIADKDRRQCETNMKEYFFMRDLSPQLTLEKLRKSCLNQHTFTPMQFVKRALRLIKCKNVEGNSNHIVQNISYQIGLLNENWQKFVSKCNTLGFFIPIVDMSLSMVQYDDAICNAIGMGCLIAERSKIEHRIMVMDNIPTWINLDGYAGNFVGMVETMFYYTTKNSVANIVKTMNMIVHSISNSENDEYFCKNGRKMELVFIVFTNQTTLWKCENGASHSEIVELFRDAKIDIPHIVYWNCVASSVIEDDCMHHGNDVSNSSLDSVVSLVSGTNAELLNHFSFIGYGNKHASSPLDTLETILNNDRYKIMDMLFEKYYGEG